MTATVTNIVIIAIVVLVIGLDILYIYRNKKSGKCIGCPYSDGKCTRCGTCCENTDTNGS